MIRHADGNLDARLIQGSAMDIACWREASVQSIDVLIAVTNNDAVNMLAAMMSGNGALQFDNVDAEIYGFDLGWRYSITERFGIEGSASYTRGRRTDVDDNLYRLPPLNGSVALSFVESGWSMRAELVAYDRQDHVSAYNDEQPTPGYGVVNAAFSWTASPAIRIDVEASNLFDRGYQDHLAGVNRVNDADIPPGERLWGAERTLGVGAVFRF